MKVFITKLYCGALNQPYQLKAQLWLPEFIGFCHHWALFKRNKNASK